MDLASRDRPLLDELKTLREAMERIEIEEQATLAAIAPRFQASATNLLHFIAFHRNNHPGLPMAMREAGLCSLEGCDGHLHASLSTVIGVLQKLEGLPAEPPRPSAAPSSLGAQALRQAHGERLLGGRPGADSGTSTAAFMTTLPALATDQTSLIGDLIEAGMHIARINCGQDGPEVWSDLVARVRAAAAGRDVRIAMDLAGPKIRIGALPSQPGVVDARPQRNRYGKLLQSARILAVPSEGSAGQPPRQPDLAPVDVLPIRNEGWRSLTIGDRLRARDSSGRWRELTVVDRLQRGLLLSCNQRCHFTSGLEFLQEGGPGRIVVGDLPAQEGDVLLRLGERLRLTSGAPGQEEGANRGREALSCTMPEVLADLQVGERVLFDGGSIAGLIREVCPGAVEVEITQARPKGNRLRANKRIRFPDSRLTIPALTSRDRSDLAFAAAHADIVCCSFVSRAAALEVLQDELEGHGRADLAVVLKIETRQAFLNLPRLLLTAMRDPRPLGVMIARGELAIECGWEELAEIQEEILRICAAAHIPCVGAPNPSRFPTRQPQSPRHRQEHLSCLAFGSNGPTTERQQT